MSGVEGSGEGLFTKRSIYKGDVVCFISGFYVANKMMHHPLDRRFRSESEKLEEKMYVLAI